MTWVDNRKISKPVTENKIKYGKYGTVKRGFSSKFLTGQMRLRAKQKEIRPEKVEEIKAIWQSPKFKTHNQRLIYLLRHCTIIEPQYGYTIREFAHAIHPEKMGGKLVEVEVEVMREEGKLETVVEEVEGEPLAFRAIRKMFNRFNHDVTNHEVILSAVLAKGTGKWYYYNIIDNEQAIKEQELRAARAVLGGIRRSQELQDIAEHSEEIEREHKARFDEIMKTVNAGRKRREKEEEEKRTNPLKFKRERDKGQGTLD